MPIVMREECLFLQNRISVYASQIVKKKHPESCNFENWVPILNGHPTFCLYIVVIFFIV